MVGLPHCSAETLSALLDGELTGSERAAARAHLDSCLDCGARLVAARRLDTDLRDASRLSCAAIFPTLSALADGEATAGERTLATAHLVDCPACRAAGAGLGLAEALLATLPAAAPAGRVDAAIAGLRRPAGPTALQPGRQLGIRPARLALRGAAAASVALVVALTATLVPSGRPSAEQSRTIDPARSAEVALVAGVQRVVFDPRTNTLYLLDPDRAEVSAVDATTQVERARVGVGGTPTALALSPATNRILVLDATTKRLTEIDTTSHAVVSYATLAVTGTPTSLQVDPANGRIVVASVSAPAANAAPSAAAAGPTGHVTVLDASTKQVETVRAVDVAPQLVVLDPTGAQALLLSAKGTTLVDGQSYKSLDQLPGGVAAAFDATGTQIAVLSVDGERSKVSFRGAGLPASLALPGRPIALITMPGGGFAALVDRGTGGEIAVIDATGHLASSTAVALAGHSITFDPSSGRFAVGGDVGTNLAFSGAAAPVAVSAPAAGAPAAEATPGPSASAAPASPRPRPSPAAPSPSPSAPAGAARPAALPPAAQPSADGTYRLGLPDNRRPVLVAGAGARLWFIDEARRLATIDTATGTVADAAQLPLDGGFTRLLLGTGHVFAVDPVLGRLSILTLRTGTLETFGFPFATTAAAFAVGTDDALWMAGGESSNVLALDPGTKRIAAIDFRTSLISALHVDSAARVWYADDAAGGLGYYDQTKRALVAVSAPRHASVTALGMDRTGTLWAGTATGQLLAVRGGVAAMAGSAGGPVAELVRDAAGGLWSSSIAPGTLVYRSLTGSGAPQVAVTPTAGLAFDVSGRPWLADTAGIAFHIVVTGTN